MSFDKYQRFYQTTFTCAGCGKKEQPPEHVMRINTADEKLDWRLWLLPEGWLFGFPFDDRHAPSDETVFACSPGCADRLARRASLSEEFKTIEREEYKNTTRRDDTPERTARSNANERMRKTYGEEWTAVAAEMGRRATW